MEGALPHFYFDVREGPRFTPDDKGLVFDDFDATEREAAEAAAQIGRDYLPKDGTREIRTSPLGVEGWDQNIRPQHAW